MADLTGLLPALGDKPWTLNPAIETINVEVEYTSSVVLAEGRADNPHTDPDADRNDDIPKNFWQCATEPTNWVDGDEWIMTP